MKQAGKKTWQPPVKSKFPSLIVLGSCRTLTRFRCYIVKWSGKFGQRAKVTQASVRKSTMLSSYSQI